MLNNSKSLQQNSEPVQEKNNTKGLLIDFLAKLPEKTILDESQLADALKVTTRTIRRMVQRFELPPSIPFRGRSVWMAGRILKHIESALEKAEQEASKQHRKIQRLAP